MDQKVSQLPTTNGVNPTDLLYLARSGAQFGLPGTALASISALVATGTKTANYTASSGDLVPCDTSGGGFTVNLPATPTINQTAAIYIVNAGNNLTVGRNGSTIDGNASNLTLALANTFQVLAFNGTTWVTVAAEGETSLASTFTIGGGSPVKGTYYAVSPDAGGTFTVVLPRAGLYKLGLYARINLRTSTANDDFWASVKLYDGTAFVPNSQVLNELAQPPTSTFVGNTEGGEVLYLASSGVTITMYAKYDSDQTPTMTAHTLESDSDGLTKMWYRLIG